MSGVKNLKTKSFKDRIKESVQLNSLEFEKKINQRKIQKDFLHYVDTGCNLSCNHCFGKKSGKYNLEMIKKNIRSCNNFGYRNSVYIGEPSINPELFDLYTITNTIAAVTNGVQWDNMLLERLKNSGVKVLSVSLHGYTSEIHSILSGNNISFEKAIETIKKAKKNFYVQIRTVIHTQNMNYITELFNLLKNLDVDELRIINIIKGGNAKKLPNSMFIDKNHAKEIVKSVHKLKMQFKKPYISFAQSFGPNFYSKGIYTYLLGKSHQILTQGNSWCPGGKTYFTIDQQDLYACHNGIILPAFKVGTFNPNFGFKFDDKKMVYWSDDFYKHITGICSIDNCEYSRFCKGGCRGFAFSENNNFYSSPPFCLTKIIEELELENWFNKFE